MPSLALLQTALPLLQERYGIAKEEAERQVDDWLARN